MHHPLRPLVFAGLCIGLAGCGSLRSAANVPTAMAAHEICSGMFVSHLPPGRVFADTVAPQLGPAAGAMRWRVDPQMKAVTASLGGVAARRAVYRGLFGCIVEPGAPAAPTVPFAAAASAGAPLPPPRLTPADGALADALDIAFKEPASGPRRRTAAVVVLHDGRIVAERYAPGVGVDTPLHGWSMSKTVTNALLGVLVQQDRLDMHVPATVPEWRHPADPRHAITPDDLLRMRSGLDLGQSLAPRWDAPFDIANQIMFAAPDMGAAAARRPLKARPGTVWTYSDGNAAILGRLIRDMAGGGDPVATQAFARRELFDIIGMEHTTVETDSVGSPVGATQVYATARDWARLGQLFLDDGIAGSRRVLPRGWVAYSTNLTPESSGFGYGAGLWTHPSPGVGPRNMPLGSFMARGARGQFVVVVPAARLVIVKLGDAETRGGDIEAMTQMVEVAVRWAMADPQRGRAS